MTFCALSNVKGNQSREARRTTFYSPQMSRVTTSRTPNISSMQPNIYSHRKQMSGCHLISSAKDEGKQTIASVLNLQRPTTQHRQSPSQQTLYPQLPWHAACNEPNMNYQSHNFRPTEQNSRQNELLTHLSGFIALLFV